MRFALAAAGEVAGTWTASAAKPLCAVIVSSTVTARLNIDLYKSRHSSSSGPYPAGARQTIEWICSIVWAYAPCGTNESEYTQNLCRFAAGDGAEIGRA